MGTEGRGYGTEPDDIGSEGLQQLPPGRPKRRAPYTSVPPPAEDPSIVNVGGYERLAAAAEAAGSPLTRDEVGLATLDRLVDSPTGALGGLGDEIGMFYGDVLTHTVEGAHWVVVDAERPEVRITATVTVDVIGVGRRRLASPDPTLVQNYEHVLSLIVAG